MSELFEWARRLQIVDVWKPNITGWQTPRVLYDRTVLVNGEPVAPRYEAPMFFVDHGTVGSNTLRFWGQGGSVSNDTYSLAKYLVPHDTTVYADNRPHDTQLVVFKMHPDKFACNNVGPCIHPVTNRNTIGLEYESLQNGTHDISESQYIKGALVYAYEAHAHNIRDHFRVPHGLVAVHWGRRTDPWAGRMDIGHSWEIVQAARRDPDIRALWGWDR